MQYNPEGTLYHRMYRLSELTVAHSLDEILESFSQFSRLKTERKEMAIFILSVQSVIIT